MPTFSTLRCRSTIQIAAVLSAILGVCSLAGPASVAQNTLPISQQAKVDAIARQVLASTGVPSASVGIVMQDKIAYLQAYGNARLAPEIAASPHMRYAIGSISKQFTAAAILVLQQQGKLRLDDTVSKWLPSLTRAHEVTLRQILSHTSGYQDYYAEDYTVPSMLKATTPDTILNKWGKQPLDFDPGTKWQYSNTNYVIAGKIIEIASGMPLMDFLQQQIFAPLNMPHVMNYDVHSLEQTDARGYSRYALGPLHPANREGTGWIFGAGELAMPVHDLLLWDISMIDRSLMQSPSYDAMETAMKLKDGQTTDYGLGIGVSNLDGHPVLSHSGGVSGFITDNVVLPKDKVAIAVFTNQDASSAASQIAGQIARLLLGLPESPAKESESQAREIFVNLQSGQIDRSLFTTNCNAYFDQQAVNDYASSLKPLGQPLGFRQIAKQLRGGMTLSVYDVFFPSKHLHVTTYQEPDGKLEQYLVIPVE